MVFNSFDFVIFFVPVFLLYWFLFKKSSFSQNVVLVVVSMLFYAKADWRFLILLLLSVLVNYLLAIKIRSSESEKSEKIFLYLGLFFNVGLLLYFKYFNFFYDGFVQLLNVFGSDLHFSSLKILVPLGISFFTFQTVGYLYDVYNEEIEPSTNLLEFSVFVLYFPKMLSGPIERAASFIPQIKVKRTFSYNLAADGLRQIIWGLFTKIVIAENCAAIVNPIFQNYTNEPGSVLVLGAFFYAIQIYADFSGYTNMAIGVSKLLGIQLTRNFATPYFSTNISDFWRKWHMTLTNWMMDYVFTPLSFMLRSYKKMGLVISIIITFLLVGFWHGDNMTFIVYGFLHGLYFIPLVYSGNMNKSAIVAKGKLLPGLMEVIKMMLLFVLIMFTAVFFRAPNLTIAMKYLSGVVSTNLLTYPEDLVNGQNAVIVGLIFLFIITEWLHREKKHDFDIVNYPLLLRWFLYILLFLLVLFLGKSAETFIYFQF